jgi:PAS fold
MGQSEKDLSIWGYKGHVLLSGKYIIPGSETSNEYEIFSIAGIYYLSYVNWRELELKEGRYIEEMICCELTSREKDLQSESENVEASLRREQQKSADYEIVPNLLIGVIELAMSELKSAIAREKVLKGTMLSLVHKTENDIDKSNCAILNHIKGQEANLMQQESLEGIIDAPILTTCQLDHDGRFCIVSKAGYTVFGWSESEIIGSTISMDLGKAHIAKHAQCVSLYLETGERHNIGNQCKCKNHLDETLMLAQRVKVSHNILYQGNKSQILIEQNRALSSSRNKQQINKCFVINSTIVPNMFEIQDCQTEQMVDSVYTQGKVLDSFWTQRKRFIEFKRPIMCHANVRQ